MFTIFNSKSLWIGKDLKKFNQIREKLEAKQIPYDYKVHNRMGQWSGRGTLRGNTGSLGTPFDQMYEYDIRVYSRDFELAEYCLRGN
ncbi:hypothetical protein [Marvinbryantia sp.]|uniref:hypothetical protein n=1 Tax=Marvinbryantia sp. TaxID=2496532 RepID=UPI0025F14C05|nr:hypothetical protein [uncultured Marvinbryantia sp.]